MIGALIALLLWLVVLAFVYWAALQLIGLVPTSEPFTTIIRVVVAGIGLIIVLWALVEILGIFGISVPSPIHLK